MALFRRDADLFNLLNPKQSDDQQPGPKPRKKQRPSIEPAGGQEPVARSEETPNLTPEPTVTKPRPMAGSSSQARPRVRQASSDRPRSKARSSHTQHAPRRPAPKKTTPETHELAEDDLFSVDDALQSLSEIFGVGRGKLVVVDEEELSRPQEPQVVGSFLSRSMHMRVDTLMAGSFLALVLLGVTFLLGRNSVDAQTRLGPVASLPTTQETEAGQAVALRLQSPPLVERTDVTEPPTTASIGERATTQHSVSSQPSVPGQTAIQPSQAAPAPAAVQTPSQPQVAQPPTARYSINVMSHVTERGGNEVKAFLEAKGFKVFLHKSGRVYNVRVGAYEDRRSGKARSDLESLQQVTYKGKREFRAAYFVRWTPVS